MAKPDVPLEESPVGGQNYPKQYAALAELKDELMDMFATIYVRDMCPEKAGQALDDLLAKFKVRKE
jgi:hypothetical protein